MENIMLGNLLQGFELQSGIGIPHQKRNLVLLFRGKTHRQAVHIKILFPKGFAVVGHVKHHRLVALQGLEVLYYAVQQIIGVNNRIIVSVQEFLLGTLAEFHALAHGAKYLKLWGIFFVVRRSVAGAGVQYHQDFIFRALLDFLFKSA